MAGVEAVDKSTVIYKYDTVNTAKVLLGCLTSERPLMDITDELPWHYEEVNGFDFISLTLAEIYEEVKRIYEDDEDWQDNNIITVLCTSPLDGIIYQCNNYAEGEWYTQGALYGYA